MKTIVIGKPKISENNSFCKWSCDITGDYINTTLYYETEKMWGKYFTEDRLDAAVVALLPYVMYRSKPTDKIKMICEAPISEKLSFQLNSELIPALIKECSFYSSFELECETKKNEYNPYAISTSISCGVDSFYTLIKSKREFPEEYKVTHGIFIGMSDRAQYNGIEYKNSKIACEKLGLEFVYVKSNIVGGIYESRHDAISTFAVVSASMVLGGLIKVHYHSSTFDYSEFKFDQHAISAADPVLLNNFSTETLQFYTCSGVVTRAEKTRYISQEQIVQDHLMVCGNVEMDDNGQIKNCSICSKCTITMIDLDVSGMLDRFDKVFHVELFKKKPLYYWGYVFYKEKHGVYIDGTLAMAKEAGYKIPLGSRICGLIKIIKNGFRRTNPYQYTFRP